MEKKIVEELLKLGFGKAVYGDDLYINLYAAFYISDDTIKLKKWIDVDKSLNLIRKDILERLDTLSENLYRIFTNK